MTRAESAAAPRIDASDAPSMDVGSSVVVEVVKSTVVSLVALISLMESTATRAPIRLSILIS